MSDSVPRIHKITVENTTLDIIVTLMCSCRNKTNLNDASVKLIGVIVAGNPPRTLIVCPHVEYTGELNYIITSATPHEQDKVPRVGKEKVDCPNFHIHLIPRDHPDGHGLTDRDHHLYSLSPLVFGDAVCAFKLQLDQSISLDASLKVITEESEIDSNAKNGNHFRNLFCAKSNEDEISCTCGQFVEANQKALHCVSCGRMCHFDCVDLPSFFSNFKCVSCR